MELIYSDVELNQTILIDFVKTKYLSAGSVVFDDLIGNMKNGVYEVVPDKLYNLYNDNFQKAIRGVFSDAGTDKGALDYLYKFDATARKFSAYKANYVSRTLWKAFQDAPDKFDDNSKRILNAFNRYQVAEYNTLMKRCRVAKQFRQFEQSADLYPNIEWIRTRSANPRELHLRYAGLILPSNHPFWIENQPGSLYNCKCSWRATDKVSNEAPTEYVEPDKGLEGNPALTREVITEKHPYFTKANKDEVKDIESYVQKQVMNQFNQVKSFKNGGAYYEHPLIDSNNTDYKDLLLIANKFAKQGKKAYILPELHYGSDLYKYLFADNGAYKSKCPDLLIDENLFEFKSNLTGSQSSISNMLNRALKQSSYIIIDNRKTNSTSNHIAKLIKDRIRNGEKIDKVYVINRDNIIAEIAL